MATDPSAKRPRPYGEDQLRPPLTWHSSSSPIDLLPFHTSLPPFPSFASYPLHPPSSSIPALGPPKKLNRKVPAARNPLLQDFQKRAGPVPVLESLGDGVWLGPLESYPMGFGRSVFCLSSSQMYPLRYLTLSYLLSIKGGTSSSFVKVPCEPGSVRSRRRM